MTNLLITGGTGFVGSHLVEAAQKEGYQVFVLVRESSDTSLLEKLGITCLKAELSDVAALETVFVELKTQQIVFDSVIHCAALTKAKDLDTFIRINADATEKFIHVLQKYQPNLQRFIFVSSLAAAGPTSIGQTINQKQEQPITNYGKSKLVAEKKIQQSTIPYTIFRPTAVFGPREKDIFTLFQLVAKGIHPLIGKHRQELTFIYVRDLVTLLLASLKTPATNQTFFVTDGKVYGKEALGNAIEAQLSKKTRRLTIPLGMVRGLAFISQTIYGVQGKLAPLNSEKYQELKAESWVCDINNTKATFNFEPQYDLQAGVTETLKWYRQEAWL